MSNESPAVSIIIVCWNSSRYIVDCLRSIDQMTAATIFEVIVVDNGSTDDTAEIIATVFPRVKLIRAGANLGFPKANNLGMRSARGDYLLLLNPDTCFKSDVLTALTTFLRTHPGVGAAGPKIIEKDGTVSLFTIRELPSLLNFFFTEFGLRKCFPRSRIFVRGGQLEWDGISPRKVTFISGAAIMIPKAVLGKIGQLDEQLPMYFEDLDLSARIINTGRQLYVVPSATVLHVGAQSSELSPARSLLLAMEDGQAPWLYVKTYYSERHAEIFTAIIFTANLLRLAALAPLFLAALFSERCAIKARRHSARSVALIKWSLCNKSRFLDHFTHIFRTV